MKHVIYFLAALMLLISCGTSKVISRGEDFTLEEVELYGIGIKTSRDEAVAIKVAKLEALGDLSTKLQAQVRTASSNYQKETGGYNKDLFESLTEVVSENTFQFVTYEGEQRPYSYKKKMYTYRIKAHVKQTVLREKFERICDELRVNAAERDAYRREMFGDS